MSMIWIDTDGPKADIAAPTAEILGIPGWQPPWGWNFLRNLDPESKDRVKAAWRRPGFARTIPPVTGAVRAVRRLREEVDRRRLPVRIGVLTTPMLGALTWREDRLWWLGEHFGFAEGEVVFAYDKRPYGGRTLLDDKVDNVQGWEQAHGRPAYLWAPSADTHGHPRVVRDWDEGYEVLLAEALSSAT